MTYWFVESKKLVSHTGELYQMLVFRSHKQRQLAIKAAGDFSYATPDMSIFEHVINVQLLNYFISDLNALP